MRWNQFSKKECIDLVNGERVGHFCDMKLNPYTGSIESFLMPSSHSWLKKSGYLQISWSMVQTVGPEMIIIDSGRSKEPAKSF